MLFADLTGQDWATIIGAVFLGAGQLYLLHLQNKVEKKIEVVHKATNSMKDALVKVTGEAEHAKGVIEGKTQAMPEATVKGREVGAGEGPPENLDAEAIQDIIEEKEK